MKILRAKPEHLDCIMQIIDHARTIMRETGNLSQWTNGYPSEETILLDIHLNQAFICLEEDEIVGYFCFFQGKDPEPNYAIIDNGEWQNALPYGVIHRLASNGKVRGVAKACFDFAFKQIDNIKVDTNHDNLPMQRFLQKYGFEYCGVIYVSDGSPRDAFQLKINK